MKVQYDVTDYDYFIGEHEILIRVLSAVDEDREGEAVPQDIGYMSCKSCSTMTQMRYTRDESSIMNLNLMEIEVNLHAEGFDTGWEYGTIKL